MSTELKFGAIKDDLTGLVDGVIRNVLEDNNYDKNKNKLRPNENYKEKNQKYQPAIKKKIN